MNATSRCDRLLSVPEQLPARKALAELVRFAPAVGRIFIHGPSGSGKSRLVQEFADELSSCATITVVAAEAGFKVDRSGEAKLLDVDDEPDVLVVEDLQFLPLNAVETFIERFDLRQAYGLPTIMTATAGPRHLRFRGDPYPARLTSRLAAGLVIAAPAPSPESRRTILDELLRDANLTVPASVVEHLANEATSIRSLEGAVNQLALLSRLEPGPMKAGPLLEHFRQQAGPEKASLERIVQRVAGWFQVPAKDVRSRSRRRGFVTARHVSMYLARRLTPLSFQQIGVYFGGCDHATVLHACRKMEQTLEADPQLEGTVRQLQMELA